MNRQLKTLGVGAFAGIVLTSAALAQAPGQGGNGGGRGGFVRPTTGAVTAVDATAGTITVGGVNGGAPQTIKVGTDTPIAVEAAGTVADLKVGDQVQISNTGGHLTVTDGTLPDAFGVFGRFLTGGFGGGGRVVFGGGAGGNNGPATAAFTVTNGKVTATSPLTISAGDAVHVTLTSTTGAKISRIMTGQLSGVKVGDQVLAVGQAGADGVVAATAVAVNFSVGQVRGFAARRGGGFGGNNQGGGFGANGQNGGQGQGGGFGANGQAGRRRRNRNGQGGGQNGGGQTMPPGDMNGTAPAPAGDDNNS